MIQELDSWEFIFMKNQPVAKMRKLRATKNRFQYLIFEAFRVIW